MPAHDSLKQNGDMMKILWVILAVWLVGLLMGALGNLIHLLLIVAVAILIYNFIAGRRAV